MSEWISFGTHMWLLVKKGVESIHYEQSLINRGSTAPSAAEIEKFTAEYLTAADEAAQNLLLDAFTIATDVLVLARTEIGEAREPAPTGCGVSSAVPHRRNPALPLISSADLVVPALASALSQAMVAEDERPAGLWHSEWQMPRECPRLTGDHPHRRRPRRGPHRRPRPDDRQPSTRR